MTVFLVVGALGVALLLIALVFGDVLEGVFDGVSGGLFSTEALAGFLGALGFGGAIALETTGSSALAAAIGLALGVVLGALAGWASKALHGSGDAEVVRTSDMLERVGTVVDAIPEGGMGVVTVTSGGHLTRLNARSSVAVPVGTTITVTSVLSPTSVQVEPLFLP